MEDSEDFAFAVRRVWGRFDSSLVLRHASSIDDALGELRRRLGTGSALPRLVLLDLNMPGLDGRAMLEALASDERLQQLPVVVLTTSDRQEDVRFAYRHGARAFHVKPHRVDTLKEMLEGIYRYWFQTAKLP